MGGGGQGVLLLPPPAQDQLEFQTCSIANCQSKLFHLPVEAPPSSERKPLPPVGGSCCSLWIGGMWNLFQKENISILSLCFAPWDFQVSRVAPLHHGA